LKNSREMKDLRDPFFTNAINNPFIM
jgi:hypothetical protein